MNRESPSSSSSSEDDDMIFIAYLHIYTTSIVDKKKYMMGLWLGEAIPISW